MHLRIRRFDKALHDRGLRNAFSSGSSSVDNLLKHSLSKRVERGVLAAFVATSGDDPSLLGFYTLCAQGIRSDHVSGGWGRLALSDIPIAFIHAVAVQEGMQGNGIGRVLMKNAMERCLRSAKDIGISLIVLDVLEDENSERRRKFYSGLDFLPLEDSANPNRMYISMSTARESYG